MPDNPLITVVVPTCNRRDLLPLALNSLAAQICRDFEVIVVNDGEEDVTDIAAAFANAPAKALDVTLVKHPRPRLGLPTARNSGIAAARGKYLIYLDDDDILYPRQLAQLSGLAERRGLPAVYSDYRLVAVEMERGRRKPVGAWEYQSDEFGRATLAMTNITPVFTVLHRADCLKRCGGFAPYLRGHEDWDLWQRLARHYPFTFLSELGGDYMYRIDGGSMSGHKAHMGQSWLFVRRQGALLLAMPPAYELEKAAAAPRWLGARRPAAGAAGKNGTVSVLLAAGDAAAFLADASAMAAFAGVCASLGGAELILAGFGEGMPQLYQKAMELRHSASGGAAAEANDGESGGAVRCAWFPADPGRLLAWNGAAGQAAGEWLLFLEPYVEPAGRDWLEELTAAGAAPQAGAVGPLLAVSGVGRCLGGRLEDGEPTFNRLETGARAASGPAWLLSSACLLVRRELFESEGGFSLAYAPGPYADADFCLRLARRGFVNVACAGARMNLGRGGRAAGLEQSPAGLFGRRVFWDAWNKTPFDLESLIHGGQWAKRPGGLSRIWPSEGRMPSLLNFPLPEKFQE